MNKKLVELVDMNGAPVMLDLADALHEINKRIIIHPVEPYRVCSKM